jgi:hypothetical protein
MNRICCMSIIKKIAAFKNWPLLYAGRYGFLRNEFEMIHRSGIRIKLGPNTDDLKIVKSNFVTMEAHRVPQEFSIDIPARLKELGFEVRREHNGGYVYAKRNKPYPST